MMSLQELIHNICKQSVIIKDNFIYLEIQNDNLAENQGQTKDIFSDKWEEVSKLDTVNKMYEDQFKWFYSLYGFGNDLELNQFLQSKKVMLDTGCGLGYKASWFAERSPESLVIGIDISDAAQIAARNYKHIKNLFFIQGDIAHTPFKNESIDFVLCDQVIMHTENPEYTFQHLSDITSVGGEFGCYVYRKKALPRELIDDYFRVHTHNISDQEMWDFSAQLTELGQRLSELNVRFTSPDIPALGIKGGEYDVQRFIYWNFLKCFWREDWGFELCKSTNYDWYAPSNAKRFSKEEFHKMINDNQLSIEYFHEEEACYSGRFKKLTK